MQLNDKPLILLVDDVQMNREILKNIFEIECDILEAANGIEALDLLREKTKIDIIVLDIVMPKLDGFGVLKAINEDPQLKNIPVIISTTIDDSSSQIKAFELGVEDIFIKPYDSLVLRSRVHNVLEHIRRRRLDDENMALKVRIEHQNQLIDLAEHDSLTGLYNQDTFSRKVEEFIKTKEPKTYVMSCLDIDHFKIINEQFGSNIGDKVINILADILKRYMTMNGGFVCRRYADVFACLLPNEIFPKIGDLTSAVQKRLNEEEIQFSIQVSIGRYIIDDVDLPVATMMDRALLAKNTIKSRYDVNVAYYHGIMTDNLMNEQWIITEMKNALKTGQFEAWYQPQYNHETGKIIGAEALVRWRHPDKKNLIPPDKFIGVFEKNGFIYELDKYMWREVCKFLHDCLQNKVNCLPVSVNVSRYDIFQNDFFEYFLSLVKEYNIPKQLLSIEITESAFAKNTEQIVSIVKDFRNCGFTVEIDDFGSGYSSLNTLKEVPANVLKIDMRFLQGNDNLEKGGNILESIVRMGRWLNMIVLAEGVETKEQADYLCSIGCSYVQGYLYARPMPQNEYLELLTNNEIEKKFANISTVNNLNTDSFWNPASLETMVFNHFSGGACIFEYNGSNKLNLLRINDKFAKAFNTKLTQNDILNFNNNTIFDNKNNQILLSIVQKSLETGEEESVHLTYKNKHSIHIKNSIEYIHLTIRKIASAGTLHLFYGYVVNVTAEKIAEEKEKESTEQLKFLTETSKVLLSNMFPQEAIKKTLESVRIYFKGENGFVLEITKNKESLKLSYEVNQSKDYEIEKKIKLIIDKGIEYWEDYFKENNYLLDIDNNIIAVSLKNKNNLIGIMGVINSQKNTSYVDRMTSLGDYMAIMINRRNYENMIINDNEQLKQMMEDTPGGFAKFRIYDINHIVPIFINKELCKMMQMSYDHTFEFYSQHVDLRVHPDDLERYKKVVQKAIENISTVNIKIRILRGDGKYCFVRVFYRVTRDINDNQYLNAYYTDLSEVESQYETLRNELLDNLPCGAATFSYDKNVLSVLYLNKSYITMVGRSGSSLKLNSISEVIHPDDYSEMIRKINEAIAMKTNVSVKVRVLDGNNKYIPFIIDATITTINKNKYVLFATYTLIK